jgi:hypothetical protein
MTADPTETLRALMPFAATLGIVDARQRLAARVTQSQLVLGGAGK